MLEKRKRSRELKYKIKYPPNLDFFLDLKSYAVKKGVKFIQRSSDEKST